MSNLRGAKVLIHHARHASIVVLIICLSYLQTACSDNTPELADLPSVQKNKMTITYQMELDNFLAASMGQRLLKWSRCINHVTVNERFDVDYFYATHRLTSEQRTIYESGLIKMKEALSAQLERQLNTMLQSQSLAQTCASLEKLYSGSYITSELQLKQVLEK